MKELIERIKSLNILVVGDVMLDRYVIGEVSRISPEAPVPILKELETETKMGMSSNVRMNLKAFGLTVQHEHNKQILEKHRLIDSKFNHHLLRYDVGEEHVLPEFDVSRLDNIKKVDAVVISDYNKGFLRYKTISEICSKFKDIPIFADTKTESFGIPAIISESFFG